MSKTQLNIIAAVCQNMGIGTNGSLPWRLKKEMEYFTTMTSNVKDPKMINAVIMGRKTWESIPDKYRPLKRRVNVIMSSRPDELKARVPQDVIVVSSLDDAIYHIEGRKDIESTWVIGGSAVYKAAMEHPNCGCIYLTEIQKNYVCDTFFPTIDRHQFHPIDDEDIPGEEQVEGDISYFYRVYKRL